MDKVKCKEEEVVSGSSKDNERKRECDMKHVNVSKKACRKIQFSCKQKGLEENLSDDIRFQVESENIINQAVEENRKRFMEKYNFDQLMETPLPGKYVWEKAEDEPLQRHGRNQESKI